MFVMKDFKNRLTQKIKQQISEGQYEAATNSWSELENVIISYSNSVVHANFLYPTHFCTPAFFLSVKLHLIAYLGLLQFSLGLGNGPCVCNSSRVISEKDLFEAILKISRFLKGFAGW